MRLIVMLYRGADKSLARPWKEASYVDQDLQHHTKTYGVQTTGILYAVRLGMVLLSLGRCSLFPFRIGLRTYQHLCMCCTLPVMLLQLARVQNCYRMRFAL